jgi:hypothetical protein
MDGSGTIRIAYTIRDADGTAGNDQDALYDKQC